MKWRSMTIPRQVWAVFLASLLIEALFFGFLVFAADSARPSIALKDAQAAFEKKQYAQSLELLDRLAREEGLSVEARTLKIRALLRLGRPVDALTEYERLEHQLKRDDEPLLREVAIGFITPLLKDMREQMRGAAYTALKELDSDETIPYFEDGLGDGSGLVRALAAEGLGRREAGRRSPRLRKALEDRAGLVKAAAIKVFGRAGDRTVIPALERAQGDELPIVRAAAYGALFRLGRKEAWDQLRRSAEALNPEERAAALRVMGELKEDRAYPILIEAMDYKQPSVRGAAAQALGMLAKPEAAVSLQRALEDPVPAVRATAALSLAELGLKESVSALKRALADSSPMVQAKAAAALLRLNEPYESVAPVIRKLAQQNDPGMRAESAKALGSATGVNAREAVESLRILLVDALPLPRMVAARSLGHIGVREAVPILKAALRDQDEAVRATAGGALARILALR